MNRLVLIILGVLSLGVVFYFVWKSKKDKQGTSGAAVNKAIDNLGGGSPASDGKIANGITGASLKIDELKAAIEAEQDYGNKIALQRELAMLTSPSLGVQGNVVAQYNA